MTLLALALNKLKIEDEMVHNSTIACATAKPGKAFLPDTVHVSTLCILCNRPLDEECSLQCSPPERTVLHLRGGSRKIGKRGTMRIVREKILLINIHLFIKSTHTFYCYYRERELNSYNTADKNILLLAWM